MDYENNSNSAVWKHLLREEKGQTAVCKYTDYKKILTIKRWLKKGLHTHLLSVYKTNLTTATILASKSDEPPTKKKHNINQIFSDTGARHFKS